MIDICVVKRMLSEKYKICNNKSKLCITQNIEVEFLEDEIVIMCWNFEYIYFSFDYRSEQEMFEIIDSFIETDRKSTRLNSSHSGQSRMPSSA